MQIYGIFTENRGKYVKNRGKCTENRGISEESIPRSGRTEGRSCGRFRSFSVIFGRFCGHIWRKSENFGEKWRISEKNGEFRGNLSVFFPFHSFLFLLLKSARFYALKHISCRYFVREVECLKYYCYFCT